MYFFTTILLFVVAASAAPILDWTSKKWDIIVVGAGPAGIIAASRAAATGLQTLLIEQGGPSYGFTGGDATELNKRRPVSGIYFYKTNLTFRRSGYKVPT